MISRRILWERLTRGRWQLIAGLTLCGVSQPLWDAVARHADYRAALGFTHLDALVVWIWLGILVPCMSVALDGVWRSSWQLIHRQVFQRLSPRGSQWWYWPGEICLATVCLVCVMVVLRGAPYPYSIKFMYITWLIHLLLSISLATALTWAICRLGWVRYGVSYTAWGLIVLPPVWFLRVGFAGGTPHEVIPQQVRRPVPLVLVVFDEFSGVTLQNEHGEIDAERYPQFARLARRCTYYPKATGVHCRTHLAVPALLSGRYPDRDVSPDLVNYPDNVLQTLGQTQQYEMFVFEPLTRLFPRDAPNFRRPLTSSERLKNLWVTLWGVYPRLLLPSDAPVPWPDLPRQWYGHPELIEQSGQPIVGRFNYPWNIDRHKQLQHFLAGIQRGEQPRCCFLHVALPHFPWVYVPDGRQYFPQPDISFQPTCATGELGEDWLPYPREVLRAEYRYELQVGYLDRFIGALQDALEAAGLWDECLLIVTADHGVSFRAGHSRRLPDRVNVAELMSVPLFIKYPGQQAGQRDLRNVETIDIVPTIAEVLDLMPRPVCDGQSLLGEVHKPRKTFYHERGIVITEADFPQLNEAIARHQQTFGMLPLARLPRQTCLHPEWLGEPVSQFHLVTNEEPQGINLIHPLETEISPAEYLPGLVLGSFDPRLTGTVEGLLIVRNDRVLDVAEVYPVGYQQHGFSVLLPPEELRPGDIIQVFLIRQRQGRQIQPLFAYRYERG
ncbi:MAG: hypothetical protein KatS3mg114_0710 [Planctomycetaceae bacterium]|nr:MAG: hypothetical protein KatS3mg114_0710 [Planctomycetaceae bacterium]